jgi:hypothetical protein
VRDQLQQTLADAAAHQVNVKVKVKVTIGIKNDLIIEMKLDTYLGKCIELPYYLA